MLTTLTKTWRKDSMLIPQPLSSTHESNKWLIWALKDILLLGSDGIKGGPNAWTVVGSCDSTQFAMDGTDYLTDYTKMVSSTGNHSWVVLRNSNFGGGTGLELCLDFFDDTSYQDEISVVYSWSAGFTGGALNARPTATDEYVCIEKSNDWPGLSSFRKSVVTRLVSTDGECYRILVNADGVTRGGLFFEKAQNPASWIDENFFLFVSGSVMDHGVLCSSNGYYHRVNGVQSRARGMRIGAKSTYSASGYLASLNNGAGLDYFGRYQLMPFLAVNMTSPYFGIIGSMADLYVAEADLPIGYTLPHTGGAHGFISFGKYLFGNDGTYGLL